MLYDIEVARPVPCAVAPAARVLLRPPRVEGRRRGRARRLRKHLARKYLAPAIGARRVEPQPAVHALGVEVVLPLARQPAQPLPGLVVLDACAAIKSWTPTNEFLRFL